MIAEGYPVNAVKAVNCLMTMMSSTIVLYNARLSEVVWLVDCSDCGQLSHLVYVSSSSVSFYLLSIFLYALLLLVWVFGLQYSNISVTSADEVY